ncbi:unnamed protein product [Parnassius apollo]|uniref:(apollo) hypothetical protein n=1 Tax=Parnassius apollo TaxID=110799 RepID=A0A8S3WZY6_PARAO|nr:unnamed protein product [Parnassius apollo]
MDCTVDGCVPKLENLIKKCKKILKTVRYRLPELEQAAEEEQILFLQSLECVSEHLEMEDNETIIDDRGQSQIQFQDYKQAMNLVTNPCIKYQNLIDSPLG